MINNKKIRFISKKQGYIDNILFLLGGTFSYLFSLHFKTNPPSQKNNIFPL